MKEYVILNEGAEKICLLCPYHHFPHRLVYDGDYFVFLTEGGNYNGFCSVGGCDFSFELETFITDEKLVIPIG